MNRLINKLFPIIIVTIAMIPIFIGVNEIFTHTAFGRPQPPVLREVESSDWSEEIAQAFYAGPKTAFCEITNEIASTTNLDQGWKSKRLGGVTVEEEPLWTETVKVFAKKSLVYQKHRFEIESHLISITNRVFTQEIVTNRNYLP